MASTRRWMTVAGVLACCGVVSACGSGGGGDGAARRAPAPAPRAAGESGAAAGANTSPSPSKPATKALSVLRQEATAELLKLAREGTPEERSNALESLQRSPTNLEIVACDALRDSSPGVRGVAALAVARAEVCACTRDLNLLLRDPLPVVRASAILALWRCGERVDPTPLAEMLKSPRANERAHAAWVLGEMGEPSARSLLAEAARDTIPRAAVNAVRLMDLQIAEARVKLGEEEALTEIRTSLYPARPEDLEVAALAAQIAGELRDRASMNSLIALAVKTDPRGQPMPPEVRLSAAMALAKMGRQEADSIGLEYADHSDPAFRAHGALVLGAVKKREHLGTLEKLLNDPSGRVRAAAAGAILELGGR